MSDQKHGLGRYWQNFNLHSHIINYLRYGLRKYILELSREPRTSNTSDISKKCRRNSPLFIAYKSTHRRVTQLQTHNEQFLPAVLTAFSVAAPTVWNSLPDHVVNPDK